MDDWTPPPIEQVTGAWVVDPWLSTRYTRCAGRSSAVMRAAALGYLYEHFKPFRPGQRSLYYSAIKKDPAINVRGKTFRLAAALPVGFRRRLRREFVAEVR